jgi:hypothetical protein
MQNRLIQTSQTGGQWYSVTSPCSIPCFVYLLRLGWKGFVTEKQSSLYVWSSSDEEKKFYKTKYFLGA